MPGRYVYKVVDFGLVNVREIAGALKLTLDRQFLGTVAYASPEQLRGEPVDARSDIYSFSAMLYELLTGRPPFDHDDPFVVITKHLTREPQPPRDLVPSIPPGARSRRSCRASSKDPAHRPASMSALATAAAGVRDVAGRRRVAVRGSGGAGNPRLRARHAGEQGPARQPDLLSARTRRSARRWRFACCAARTSPTGTRRATGSSARRGRCRSTTRT